MLHVCWAPSLCVLRRVLRGKSSTANGFTEAVSKFYETRLRGSDLFLTHITEVCIHHPDDM